MYTYVAVFSFLHPGHCMYVYMLRVRLYYNTCTPLQRPLCMYTVPTRMTTLVCFDQVGPDCQTLPCVRRYSWWVPAVRGANRFFARAHFLACEDVAGGSQQSGGKRFFAKYGGPSGGSPLSGGGIIILRVIRRHFLACGRGPSCQPLHV